MFSLRASLSLPALLVCILVSPADAQIIIPAGFDLLEVDETQSVFDFSQNPIPAGAFGPGSDPFSGIVPVRGVPVGSHPGCPGDDLAGAHALLERTQDLVFPTEPFTATVPVEIEALGLRSIDPITVTFDGNKRAQQFNMYWCAHPPAEPNPPRENWPFTRELEPPHILIPTLPFFPSEAESVRVLPWPDLPGPSSPAVPAPMTPDTEPVPWTWARPVLPDKSVMCGADLCVNGDTPRIWDLGAIKVYLKGLCTEPPIGVESVSWTSLKGRYR